MSAHQPKAIHEYLHDGVLQQTDARLHMGIGYATSQERLSFVSKRRNEKALTDNIVKHQNTTLRRTLVSPPVQTTLPKAQASTYPEGHEKACARTDFL